LNRLGFKRTWRYSSGALTPELSSITLGSGILTFWTPTSGRAVSWDVTDPDQPRLLGIAPIPSTVSTEMLQGTSEPIPDDIESYYSASAIGGQTSPLLGEDGNLGYALTDGILWLEFPQLMKGDGA
jgi:hypothetical protein